MSKAHIVLTQILLEVVFKCLIQAYWVESGTSMFIVPLPLLEAFKCWNLSHCQSLHYNYQFT